MTYKENIKAILECCFAGFKEEIIEAACNRILEIEPKTGHWIMTSDYYTGAYGTIDYVKCSCCGKDSLEEGNFCPNCGAKMVEPKESDVV